MDQHRSCKCGAVYRRTHRVASSREMDSFECILCGETMESWNSAWVPTYQLIIEPARPCASEALLLPGSSEGSGLS
jgi:hypothetical protein